MWKIVQNKVNSMGYKLLRMNSYPKIEDDYLKVIVVEKDFEYVCWIYNMNDDAFYNGYYTNDFSDAIDKLEERINYKSSSK